MTRWTTATASIIALALVASVLPLPVHAHAGHGQGDATPFDPNAPKRVSPETALAIGLKTAEIDFGQVAEVMRLTGSVRARPDRQYAVAPRTVGILRALPVQPGDTVKRGDVVAEIESQELAKSLYEVRRLELDGERMLADVQRASSAVRTLEIEQPAAVALADAAEAEVARLAASGAAVSANLLAEHRNEAIKLRAEAATKAVALEQAKAEVQTLRAQATAAQRAVEVLRALFPPAAGTGGTEVLADPARPGLVRYLAPMDGVVTTRTGVVGQGVEAGATVLAIANFASVQIDGEVPESLVDGLAAAGKPTVRVSRAGDNAPVTTGTVRVISPVIDASKRTAHVIIDAENPAGALRQGMFVELAVVLRLADAVVVVPRSAILHNGQAPYVFIKDHDLFKMQDIAIGVMDDRVAEVKEGLAPGDEVIVQGAFSVSQLRGVGASAPPTATAPATKPATSPAGNIPPDGKH